MADYGELAQKLSNQRTHTQSSQEAGAERSTSLADVFEHVKHHVSTEIEKWAAPIKASGVSVD